MSIRASLQSRQAQFLFSICLAWLLVFTLTRITLFLNSIPNWADNASLLSASAVFLKGFCFDLVFLCYFSAPILALLLLIPGKWLTKTSMSIAATLLLFFIFFVAASEWFFWDEFSTRFNFIAVDYLVYSKEVIDNIRESYPVNTILTVLFISAAILVAWAQPLFRHLAQKTPLTGIAAKSTLLLAIILPPIFCGFLIDKNTLGNSKNAYFKELAGNGPYDFFAAFRNNTLDYDQFYADLPDQRVATILHKEVREPNNTFTDVDPDDIRRTVDNQEDASSGKHNVVVVTIESLSAKYLGSFGDNRNLTPFLDQLRKESLFFNNFYATGTRTDRGLEAVTLSIPPTPGRSIVKRVGHESGYGSLGQQLTARGYDSVFVYGGRGYFDNMNAFFSGNGYRIVDQSSVPESEIHFKNAWGMDDVSLYTQAIKVADADYSKQQPFFMHIMTTSNHRPYTYPDGKIDIPSGKGRDGAVKYTDYAIKQFLTEARKKPWFDNTIFIFLADHCAGSAGIQDLPVNNYHIPLWIYAPSIVKAQESSRLASQIDVAPTVMALLKLNYVSTFFGRNLLQKETEPPRALIGNYQHLGLFDGKDLAILSPGKVIRKHEDALGESREVTATQDDSLVVRTIAYYQLASDAYKKHFLDWQPIKSASKEKTP